MIIDNMKKGQGVELEDEWSSFKTLLRCFLLYTAFLCLLAWTVVFILSYLYQNYGNYMLIYL